MMLLAGCSGGATTTTVSSAEEPDAEQVQTETLDAIDAVESYHVSGNTTVVQSANNREQEQEIISDGMVDRTAERMQMNQTISARGMSQETNVYFVNNTLYQYNPAYASQYGSEWVKVESAGAFFDQQDTLSRQRAFLSNATVTLNGTETIDGTEVQMLDADVDEEATREAIMSRLGGANQQVEYNVTSVDQRLWIDTETNRPLRSTVSMNANITAMGQSMTMDMDIDMSFEYDSDVSISLPEDAESAVSMKNQTAQS